jgi:CO dehydrogenase/acetyl-CoA synthase epsilon subunit
VPRFIELTGDEVAALAESGLLTVYLAMRDIGLLLEKEDWTGAQALANYEANFLLELARGGDPLPRAAKP